MLLAHKIELRPNDQQQEFLAKSFGCRRHCWNQLLAHFKQEDVKWSKKAAYEKWKELRVEFPFYAEVSSRTTRNVIDDLDKAFAKYFRHAKNGDVARKLAELKSKGKPIKRIPYFPKFRSAKDDYQSFRVSESAKFDVLDNRLRIEKLKTKIKLRQRLRWEGLSKQVTVSRTAGKYFASILVEVENYPVFEHQCERVGVDVGVRKLAVAHDGENFYHWEPNQKLKKSLSKLAKLNRKMAKQQKGSNRRARTKLKLQKLYFKIANQRKAVTHELTDVLTAVYKEVVIEDLNVKGMVKNKKLARHIHDAGFGMFRSQLEYKAHLRSGTVVLADRFFPSSKLCHVCDTKNSELDKEEFWICPVCNTKHDRDECASINLFNYSPGRGTAGLKTCTQEFPVGEMLTV